MADPKMLPESRKYVEGSFDPPTPQPTVFRTIKGKKSLHDWIRLQFAREDQEGFVTSIVLEHQVAPNTYEVHHTVTVGQSNADPLEISKLLWDVADTYCQDLSGNHFFRLAVFWNSNTVWGAIHPFVVGGRIDPTLLAAENPDQKGLLQSGMHYAQQTQELYLKHMDSMLARLNETLMTFASSQARLMDENTKAYDACKSLLLEKELNKQGYEMEKLKYERSSAERKEMLGMVMPAVNAITGKEIFQYNASDSKLFEMLVDLPADELEKMIEIASRNNPKLFALLMSRFHTIANTKQLPHRTEETLTGRQSPEQEFGPQAPGSGLQPGAESVRAEPEVPSPEPVRAEPVVVPKEDVVKEFMNLSDDDILNAIQNDPALMAKFKTRMGRSSQKKSKGKP